MRLKLWHAYAFNSVTFVGWTAYQLVTGPILWALAFNVLMAVFWMVLLVREKKRDYLIESRLRERALR